MVARSISMPVFATAVILVLLLVGGMVWHFLGPKTGVGQTRSLTAEEQANQAWLKQKAKETGGDFTKLSPEDQRRLFVQQGAQGPFVLRQIAHPVNISQ